MVVSGILCILFGRPALGTCCLDAGALLLLYSGLEEQRPLQRIGYVVACATGSLLVSTLASSVVQDRGLCGLSGTAHGADGHIGDREHKEVVSGRKMVPCRQDEPWDRGNNGVMEVLQGHVFFEFLHFGMMGLPVPQSHAGGVLSGIVAFLVFGSLPFGTAEDHADKVLVVDHSQMEKACMSKESMIGARSGI